MTSCLFQRNRFGIIFVSVNNGATDIYQVPDNTRNKVEQLTFTPTVGEGVLLASRDGEKIVLGTGPTILTTKPSDLVIEELYRIYFFDTVSKELKDITDIFTLPPTITPPMQVADWSPDQKQFAFINYETGLGIMNFDGTDKQDIFIPSLGDIPDIKSAKWSPDGKKIALIHGYAPDTPQHVGWALLIYDLESGRTRQIADYETNCTHVEWSASSQQVVATCSYVPPYSEFPGRNAIHVFNVENPGQPYERIAFTPCYEPSWSPDGKQIAFVCDKETDQAGLFVVDSDGNGLYEVELGDLRNPAILKSPTWSPDGAQIVYVAGSDYEHTNIYSVNLDGSNNHSLTDQEAYYDIVSVYPLP
jgi:Tol biopolymer transport system component